MKKNALHQATHTSDLITARRNNYIHIKDLDAITNLFQPSFNFSIQRSNPFFHWKHGYTSITYVFLNLNNSSCFVRVILKYDRPAMAQLQFLNESMWNANANTTINLSIHGMS